MFLSFLLPKRIRRTVFLRGGLTATALPAAMTPLALLLKLLMLLPMLLDPRELHDITEDRAGTMPPGHPQGLHGSRDMLTTYLCLPGHVRRGAPNIRWSRSPKSRNTHGVHMYVLVSYRPQC